MIQITDKAQKLLDNLESKELQSKVEDIIALKPAAFGSLSVDVLERIQLSVLRLVIDNRNRPEKIEKIKTLYITDTRDLLMAARLGFDMTSHIKWFEMMQE